MNNSQKPQSGEILPCGFFVVFGFARKSKFGKRKSARKSKFNGELCMDVKNNIMTQFPVIRYVHELK